MSWWSWIVIWAVLVLAMLGMYALLGWRLFRKASVVLGELSQLGAQVGSVQDNVEQLTPEPSDNAILLGYAEMYRRRDIQRQRRADEKELRREKRLERGKLLTTSDYRQRTWPHAR
ncbi:hypothetical protein B7R54_08760 [Subtercola boreus]|uniref:Uncharacterized protein n=1 Tax=Subtercola boreus TaxID=120213 RepID=A0A3E0VHW9_9MICO|nr:hypothetical protein [Subtercola boreus]RFA09311.1 hypothetical protein B7R54_08760 [Subtercola boreus]TQL53660.1 hypothetical protein FB464_1176 [Subtercola boreus]